MGASFVWFDRTVDDDGQVDEVLVADPGDSLIAVFVPAG